MNVITRILLVVFCFFALSINLLAADQAPVTSFLNETDTSITGYDAGLKISFSSQVVDDSKTVLVDIQLGGKRITNRVDITDPKNITFELKAVDIKTGKLTNLSAKELRDLTVLASSVGYSGGPAHRWLSKTLDLVLMNDPDGEDIDLSTQKIKEELEKIKKGKMSINAITPQGFTSLCPNLGQTMTGQYTIKVKGKEQLIEEQDVVGPCYSGECLGRCGPLCNGEQSYTQECFNHDLCTRYTGKIMGPCRDEFWAAADGWAHAPDCADMSGQWLDNYAYIWNLGMDALGNITGTVYAGACGTWDVTGKRAAQDITLTATNPAPSTYCCTAFTYSGTQQCGSASGSWTNECSLSGSWTMLKDGTTVTGATVLPRQFGPSPAASQ
ncbi:hypothetical protein ER57_10820 [Smithella sp. SCADC]|jgi:hypothetical protein|nr:hypothetical protein ER57_10820 [Smithella sp. SCADC]